MKCVVLLQKWLIFVYLAPIHHKDKYHVLCILLKGSIFYLLGKLVCTFKLEFLTNCSPPIKKQQAPM